MNIHRLIVPVAVLVLAAGCSKASNGENTDAATENTSGVVGGGEPDPRADTQQSNSPGPVDTAGMGTNPPTADGQIVDTAAVPGPTDTAQGTPTAP